MTIPTPEPVAVAFLAECGNVAYTGHLEGPYRQLRALSADGRRGASLALITTTQAEAYKDACVREALEKAESIVRSNADACASLAVRVMLHSNADAIHSLIPPLPGPVEP